MEHTNVSDYNDWSIISLYLARIINEIEKEIERDKIIEAHLKKEQ
jgi:hypothetical protein